MNTGRPRYSKPPLYQSGNAKRMRRKLTPAEKKLWYVLRHVLVTESSHFRRQVPLGPYIADFCCLSAKLTVKVDGGQHFTNEAEAYDAAHTQYLNQQGFKILRFSNHSVLTKIESVADTIYAALETPANITLPIDYARREYGRDMEI